MRKETQNELSKIYKVEDLELSDRGTFNLEVTRVIDKDDTVVLDVCVAK
jgi:hypothetical protein